MYEHKQRPLLSRRKFFQRVSRHIGVAIALIATSLIIGSAGYHFLAKLDWLDSFLNASMILGGMGPVDTLHNKPSKLFAAFYALYAGFVLLISVGIIVAPIFHRLLHRFHIEKKSEEPGA